MYKRIKVHLICSGAFTYLPEVGSRPCRIEYFSTMILLSDFFAASKPLCERWLCVGHNFSFLVAKYLPES